VKESALHALVIIFLAWLALTVCLFGLSGCTTAPATAATLFSAPTVSKTWSAVSKARDTARDLEVAAPAALRPGIAALSADLATAQQSLSDYATAVGTQTDALNSAEADKNAALLRVSYLEGKREKALRELWFWRLITLAEIGCVIGWIALRGGIRAVLP
jgi:hypothetical protein